MGRGLHRVLMDVHDLIFAQENTKEMLDQDGHCGF